MYTYSEVKFSGEYQAEIYYLNLQKKPTQNKVIESMDNTLAIVLLQ